MSLPGWPYYDEDEIEAVAAVLRSAKGNYWFGEQGAAFEREFADYCGVKYALAVANGTVALELALRSLEIGPGDEVIVTPRSFIASANCILLCGATPVFADIDSTSQNISPETVARAVSDRTRAIIAVHLAGWPCDMPAILDVACERGIHVIEDCAQAHGAAITDRKAGSFGAAAAFSFCQDKIISTGGEGGMMLTDDEEIWARAAAFRNHGRDPRSGTDAPGDEQFSYMHGSFGSNYRLTEMQSAIGRLQLQKLEGWLETRRQYAGILNERLEGMNILRLTVPPPGIKHAYYKYYAFLRPEYLREGWDRKRILRELNSSGVPCSTGICPEIYREKAYADRGFAPRQRLEAAAVLGETSLMLPVHPTLAGADVSSMAEIVGELLLQAGGDS